MLPLVSSRRSPITFGGSGSPAPSMTASACQPLKERLPIVDFWRRSNSARLTEDVRARFQQNLAHAEPARPGNSTSKCLPRRQRAPGCGCACLGRLRGEDLTDHHCGLADHPDVVHGGLERGIRDEAQNRLARRSIEHDEDVVRVIGTPIHLGVRGPSCCSLTGAWASKPGRQTSMPSRTPGAPRRLWLPWWSLHRGMLERAFNLKSSYLISSALVKAPSSSPRRRPACPLPRGPRRAAAAVSACRLRDEAVDDIGKRGHPPRRPRAGGCSSTPGP